MDKQDDKQECVIPKLRFPEFQATLGWDKSILLKICSITNGKANAQDHIENGKYPLFDRSEVIKSSNNYLFDCEVVIIPGEGMRFTPKYYKGKFNLHQRAYALKDFTINGKFVYYSMDNNSNLLLKKAVQSTVLSLRLPILHNFQIVIPRDIKEQQKIADCLSSIDELIELQEQKLAALKQHKKGLMQQLFPSHNDLQASKQASKQAIVYPKLRFPQFKDCKGWRVMRLGSIFNFFPTNSFSRDKLDERNGTIKNIHYGDIHTKFSALFDIEKESVPFISDAFVKKIRENHYCKEGDLIFADASEDLDDIGKAIEIVNLNNEIMVSGLHTLLARPIESYFSIGFLGHLFQSNLMKKQIQKESQGTKVLGISTKRLNDILVIFPSTQEQQAIADCLSSLDKLISEENEQIGRLKDHKKGLMQQLFPIFRN